MAIIAYSRYSLCLRCQNALYFLYYSLESVEITSKAK